MPVTTLWDDNESHQIIHMECFGGWTLQDYEDGLNRVHSMIQTSNKPVTVIFQFTEQVSTAYTSGAYRLWYGALEAWAKLPFYAQFWLIVKPGYWERVTMWALAKLYNPSNMIVVPTYDDARKIALERLRESQSQ